MHTLFQSMSENSSWASPSKDQSIRHPRRWSWSFGRNFWYVKLASSLQRSDNWHLVCRVLCFFSNKGEHIKTLVLRARHMISKFRITFIVRGCYTFVFGWHWVDSKAEFVFLEKAALVCFLRILKPVPPLSDLTNSFPFVGLSIKVFDDSVCQLSLHHSLDFWKRE